jgi:uncharacterized protein involved in tellurium resistance
MKQFNQTSKSIQKVNIDLETDVKLINSLKSFVQTIRNDFGTYERKTKLAVVVKDENSYTRVKGRTSKIKFHDGNAA